MKPGLHESARKLHNNHSSTIVMKYLLIALFPVVLLSCTTAHLSVPADFRSQSARMSVKGLNGWQINQRLSFGNYTTSPIKRGWDFTASLQYTKFRISPEEAILRVFDIRTEKGTNWQRNKFQYTIEGGGLITEIYATEKFKEKQLVYKSNNPWIGNASKTHRYEYAFTAAVVPLTLADTEPWSVVLINKYDINSDTARGLFDRPYVEEEGYATNGRVNIAIRPLRQDEVTTRSGQQRKVWGGKMLTGYELQWEGRVAAMIDLLDNAIWMRNDLDDSQKLILSSISSAILLKRMQDVEKDKERFDR
jgi:hypothetical protein